MRSTHHNHPDGPRRGGLARIIRAIVFVALLPAILVAGVILLPVFAIGRLFGLGGGHACGRHRRDAGDAASAA
jgi:hypothetical protein